MTAIYVSAKNGAERWNVTVFARDGEIVFDAECATLGTLADEVAHRYPIAIAFVNGRAHRWSVRAH